MPVNTSLKREVEQLDDAIKVGEGSGASGFATYYLWGGNIVKIQQNDDRVSQIDILDSLDATRVF